MVLGANTFGSDFDTLTAVWIGSQLDALTPVACSDGNSTVFKAEAGITYLVQVGGWFGDSGQLSFRLREVDAGVISCSVTEAGTGTPLRNICVQAADVDLEGFSFASTDAGGGYEVVVRPGAYLVAFSDECDESSDYRSEWYDDAKDPGAATEVTVMSSVEVSNIDAALEPSCPGLGFVEATHVIGTAGPDVLVGGSGSDIICGLGGNDRIRGEGGRDDLIGGPGRDKLIGGEAHDVISGDEGRDTLIGGAGPDSLSGDAGRDRMVGGEDNDFLQGGKGQDGLRGGSDGDDMFGDAGDDEVSGGGGDDDIEGEKGSDDLSGGAGDDRLLGKDGDDTMNGGAGKDLCDGDEGVDRAGPTCERTKDVP
jgi:Ca2+-binding RTX toxin-like protein